MHFTIHCLDKAGAVEQRLAHYDAHKAYLSSAPITMLVSGPLLAPDHETMIGSFFLVEADSQAQVEAFHNNDPFKKAAIWEKVSIHPFLKRVDNRAAT
ncbi:YciI family protein [Acidisoma cellulosilytica]|uniref:YciI family protein n=1 Tax=Acidisoma cellulosilyticum TaxID=2802395 RepID=A0A964E4I2_9PROT|nr:YciI family protein [Acidisoma cellulosilyticum]MCB8881504.1 YciI family protein [Acidisoma cellulosilyticum]